MKKTYTKEEKAVYYRALRERWNRVKNIANEDEIKAILMAHGLSFSIRSYFLVAQQMAALGLDGIPYVDTKTYKGWQENGFQVRKGEKSNIDGITWIAPSGGEDTAEEVSEEKSHYVFPKVYHLFHRSQVEAIQ